MKDWISVFLESKFFCNKQLTFEHVKASPLEHEIRALEWFLQSGNWSKIKYCVQQFILGVAFFSALKRTLPRLNTLGFTPTLVWEIHIWNTDQLCKYSVHTDNVTSIGNCTIMPKSLLRMVCEIISIWVGVFTHCVNYDCQNYAVEALMFKQLY